MNDTWERDPPEDDHIDDGTPEWDWAYCKDCSGYEIADAMCLCAICENLICRECHAGECGEDTLNAWCLCVPCIPAMVMYRISGQVPLAWGES